jgi:hypothetical protein
LARIKIHPARILHKDRISVTKAWDKRVDLKVHRVHKVAGIRTLPALSRDRDKDNAVASKVRADRTWRMTGAGAAVQAAREARATRVTLVPDKEGMICNTLIDLPASFYVPPERKFQITPGSNIIHRG